MHKQDPGNAQNHASPLHRKNILQESSHWSPKGWRPLLLQDINLFMFKSDTPIHFIYAVHINLMCTTFQGRVYKDEERTVKSSNYSANSQYRLAELMQNVSCCKLKIQKFKISSTESAPNFLLIDFYVVACCLPW